MKNKKEPNLKITMLKDKGVLKKKVLLIIVLIIIISFFIYAFYTIFNKFNKKVFKNIYLENIDVSKYTSNQLEELLNNMYEDNRYKTKIILRQDGKEVDTILPEELDFEIDVSKTKEKIYNYGRKNNIIINNWNIFKLNFNKKIFKVEYKLNLEKLNTKLKLVEQFLENKVIDDQYELDESNFKLIITKGKKGQAIDLDKNRKNIIELLQKSEISELEIVVTETEPKPINIDEMYNSIYRKPVNAEIKDNDGKKEFIREVYGLDFSKDDLAKKIAQIKESGEILKYDLEVSAPMIKFEDIAWSSYDDVLSSVTTHFSIDSQNKSNNINIATTTLNGVVVMPGETFSYNSIIGEVSSDKGYKNASVYMGTSIVDGIGGGICQTVSTLYNAVLYANLEIVSRSQHSMPVGYVKPSLDATMYYPNIDFKFKNNRNFPIKIKTTYSWAGNINFSILGTKEDTDVEVELESNIISEDEYTTKTIIDNNMEPGKQLIKQTGANGYSSEAYKITKKNGKIINRELISKDRYKPIQKIVVQGPDSNGSEDNE